MLIVGIDVCYLPIADIRKRLQAAGGACWCDEAQDLAGSRMKNLLLLQGEFLRTQRQAMVSVQREIGAGGNAPHDDPENALGEIRVLQLVAN